MRLFVAVIAAAPALDYLFVDRGVDLSPTARIIGNLIWITSLLPAWTYLGQSPDRRRPIPFIPIIALVYGLCFGLQAALGQANLFFRIVGEQLPRLDPLRDYDAGLYLALIGWIVMLCSHWMCARLIPTRNAVSPYSTPPMSARSKAWALGLLALSLAVEPLRAIGVPVVLYGVLIFANLAAYYGVGLLAVYYVRGQLRGNSRMLFFAALALLISIRLARGQAAGLTYLIAAVFIGAWVGKARVGWRAIVIGAVLAVVVVTLRGLVVQYRAVVWYGGGEYSFVQRLAALNDIAALRIKSDGLGWMITAGATMVAQRSAYVDMFADVIRQTPNPIPYWRGRSYVALFGSAIPRVLWPSKPLADVGLQYGRRYGYVSELDERTAINLPYLIEFYVNFGAIGVILGMAIVGAIYAVLERLVNRPGQSAELSMGGLALLLPLFNIESDFAVTFGALPLNGAAIWFVYRQITGPGIRSRDWVRLPELGVKV